MEWAIHRPEHLSQHGKGSAVQLRRACIAQEERFRSCRPKAF